LDTTSLAANRMNQKNMNLIKQKIILSFSTVWFAKNIAPLKSSFQLLFSILLLAFSPHNDSTESLSTDTHIQQQTIYKRIRVMAVPLLATIAFLLQAQTAEKAMVTSPCSKAPKKKTLTTSCNPQDMHLGHRATRYPSATVRHNREVGKHDGRLEGP
jgi:hypothetical protein